MLLCLATAFQIDAISGFGNPDALYRVGIAMILFMVILPLLAIL